MIKLKKLKAFSKTLKVLYVEDNEDARTGTLKMFSNLFDNITVGIDGEDGLEKFKSDTFDIVITDINMPKMNGVEMLQHIRDIDDKVPCIVISAHTESNFLMDTIKIGVDGYIIKPIDISQFIDTISKTLHKLELEKQNKVYRQNLEILNTDLESQVIERIGQVYALNEEIVNTQKEVIFTLAAIGESRSRETGNHVKRVAKYTKILAKAYGMSDDESDMIKMASPMHDIGKVGIPDSILNKNGKHTPEETIIMKTHAQMGYEMLKNSKRPILQASAIIAYQHHEKYDGSGYPQGLKGEEIHIYGRISAIADVFDALGSSRVYKAAWDDEKIFKLFKEEQGKHFDPKLIDIFFDNLNKFLAVRDEYK